MQSPINMNQNDTEISQNKIEEEEIDLLDQIVKEVEKIISRTTVLLLDEINMETDKNKELNKLFSAISNLPSINLEGISKLKVLVEEGSIIKTQLSLYIEKEALRGMNFFDDKFQPTRLWVASENFRESIKDKWNFIKSPDFFTDGVPGDVKTDYTGTLTEKAVRAELLKNWGMGEKGVILPIIVSSRTVEKTIPRDKVELVRSLIAKGAFLNDINKVVEKNKLLLSSLGMEIKNRHQKTVLEEAFDKIPREHKDKFMCNDMVNFLNQKIVDLETDNYIDVFMEYLGKFSERLIDSSIGAVEMVNKLSNTFRIKKKDKTMIDKKEKVESLIKEKQELLKQIEVLEKKSKTGNQELIYNTKLVVEETDRLIKESMEELEKELRKEYGHGNLQNLPLGTKREVINGSENFKRGDNFEDLEELMDSLLRIRRIEVKSSDNEEKKTKMVTLKREKQILKTSGNEVEKNDVLLRALAINTIDKELYELREEINKELVRERINSDGSYTLHEKLIDKLRSGSAAKFMAELISSHEDVLIAYMNIIDEERKKEIDTEENKRIGYLNKLYDLYEERLREIKKKLKEDIFLNGELSKEKEMDKKRAVKTGALKVKNNLRTDAIKRLNIGSFTEVFDPEVLLLMLKRDIGRLSFADVRKIPSLDWGMILEEGSAKIDSTKELQLPTIDFEGFSDIKSKTATLMEVKKDFENTILTHMRKDKDLILLSEEAEMLRGLVMLGKPRNAGDKKGESPYSIAYYKNMDIMVMIGNQTGDYNTASVRILFKAKEYKRPFMSLNYNKFEIEGSEECLWLSNTFRLNKKFTENWLEIYGAGLGLSSMILSYGNAGDRKRSCRERV